MKDWTKVLIGVVVAGTVLYLLSLIPVIPAKGMAMRVVRDWSYCIISAGLSIMIFDVMQSVCSGIDIWILNRKEKKNYRR